MKITIDKIPDLNYEGYIWYSNAQQPEVIKGKFDIKRLTLLPFVIEGNLWNEHDKISINIKNIDGNYLINIFDLKTVANFFENTQEYVSHRIEHAKAYKIYQHWEAIEDDLCEKMSSYQPTWNAFVGFSKTNNEEE